MEFEWDPTTAAANARKHGVTFDEAMTVFADSRRGLRVDEMRPHHDLSSLKGVVRGKYAAQYAAGPYVVRLAPDVAPAFRSDVAVNAALRRYLHDTAGRAVAPMTADQLLESLLDEREALVATIARSRVPLSLAQIRREFPAATPRTMKLLLARCELDGRLRRVTLRGANRWSASET